MGTCPTRYGFIQELTDEYNLTPEQKIAAAKVYEKLKSIKIDNSLEVQKTSRTLPKKYYTVLNTIVRQGLGPKVTTSEYLGLSKAVVGAIDIVAGQTRNNKNIVLSKTPRQDALKAQAEGIFEAWYTEKSPYATQFVDLDEEAFVDALRNDEVFQQNKDNETTKIMAEALAGFAKINGMHTLAHEMVHVGAVEFMKENPTHEYTRRVNSLYQEALVEKARILKHMGKGRSEYWTTSVDEFLAEALSNPDLVFALTNIRTEGKEKYSTLFRNLLHALLSMVGIKTSDSMYTYVLDGYLAMVEHKANSAEYAKKMDELSSRLAAPKKEEPLNAKTLNTVNTEINDTMFLNKEYSKLFKETAKKFLTYRLTIEDNVLLNNLRVNVDTVVPGDYDRKTGNIRVVSNAVNDMELSLAVMVGVDTKAVKELYRLVDAIPAIEDQTGFVESATMQPEYKKLVNETMLSKLDEITKVLGSIDSDRVLVHELTHVAAVKFMAKTPVNRREKDIQERVHMLFEDAKTRYTAMGNDIKDTTTAYWAKDINEFLAEAMSNPQTIKLLESMKTGKMGRLSTVLRMLVDALAALVGTKKNKDNVYFYTLDSLLAIVEDTKKENTVKTSNIDSADEKINSIYTAKVDKQEIDEELLLGDDAMKDYKPKKAEVKQGTDVTEQFTNIIGNRVAVNYNGAIAVDRMISKVVDMGDYVTAVLEHDGKYETYKFANGEKTGTSEKGTKVTINDMDKFTSFVLGNKKKDDKASWDSLKEQTDYVHGDKDSMKEMLNTLHTLGGKKATAEDMEYYETLIDSMNSEFFNKMKLYLKNTSRESAGQVKRYRLDFAVSKAPMLAGNQQTEAEIYLHEVVHTMVKFARMSNTLESRRIERELEHVIAGARTRITWKALLPEVSINAKLEEANAKEMFEYIFNSENYVDEFIAHVLTNPQLRKVSEKIHLNTAESKSLLDRAVDLFKTLMDVVLGNYKFKEKNNTIYDQVKGLAIQLGEINAHADRAAESEKGMLAVGMDMLNKLDDKAAAKLNELKNKYLVDNERLEDYPKNSSKAVKAAWMLKVLKKSAINEDYGKALGLVMTSYGIKPDGIIRNVLNDFKEPSDFEKTVEWLQLASDKVEGERNSVINAGKKLVVAGFKKKLNKAEEKALLRTVLDLDMQVLLEQGYSIGDVRRLLEDKDLLDREIGKAKHELELLDKKYYNWHTTQATGLGYYLATHKAAPAQNFNAFNIARGLISNHYKRPEKGVVQAIDKVATLVGMYYTDPRQKEIAAGLFKEEYKGVQNLMAIHRGYNAESKRTLFSGNETQMIKGYSKEIFDDSIETQVAPLEEREELEQAGYIFKGELKGKYGDSTAVPMGLFVSSSFSRNELLRGATRLTKMGARGTTLTETKYNDGGDFAKERAARDIVRMDIERLKIVKQMLEGTFDATTAENGIAPVLDAEGNVVNYRYMMDKEMKEDVLKQDTSVSEIMGRTQGAMLDKLESKKHNVFVLKNILDNMAKNWTSGLLGNDGLTEYTLITPNSTNQEIKELYRILPKEFKAAINARPDKTLAIPTSMKALYFGYRHLSIVDVPGIKILPKVMLQIIKMMEAMWIEIVKIAKTNILLKVPNVAISNMISNVMRGINIGIDPVTLMKTYVESFRDVRAHVKKHRELVALQLKQTSGRATRNDKDRIKALEKELKSNPVHELMVKGFYQAFQEDVENAELRSSNKVKKWIDEQVENVPGVIKTPMQWLYLSEETAFYKASQELMQMSDLVSRVVEIRHLDMLSEKQANGKRMMPQWRRDENPTKERTIKLLGSERNKFLKRAHEMNLYATLQAYINYNKPSSQVEDYLDRTGSVRFTKFVKRIQLVNAKTTIEHPIKTALLALTKAFVWNVDNTFDQSLFMKQWYTRGYGPGNIVPLYSPLDTISTAAEPGLIKLVTG